MKPFEIITKNDGDVQKVRHEDDIAASVDKMESEIDYIAMMDGIEIEEEVEEQEAVNDEQ